MSTCILDALTGMALGALGGGMHLWVVHYRTRVLLERGALRALLAYPLGLVPPAIALLTAARYSPQAAWFVPLGILLVRTLILLRARNALKVRS